MWAWLNIGQSISLEVSCKTENMKVKEGGMRSVMMVNRQGKVRASFLHRCRETYSSVPLLSPGRQYSNLAFHTCKLLSPGSNHAPTNNMLRVVICLTRCLWLDFGDKSTQVNQSILALTFNIRPTDPVWKWFVIYYCNGFSFKITCIGEISCGREMSKCEQNTSA